MTKASDRAYQHIRGAILDGSLVPGAQLREEQLAAACGVSRTPVRDALRRLEGEHYVRRNESQRTFVAEWSLDEIEEGFVLRSMLEGYAAARAALRISDSAIEQLCTHNRAIDAAAQADPPDVSAFLDHNRAFHAIVLEGASSERLADLLAGIVEQPVVTRTARQYDRGQIQQSRAEHDELIVAFRRRDPDWARAVMTSHIRRAFHAYHDAFHQRPGKR
ncbi:GntR family transcriptional regulator [Sphingomonas flavalba]|uniref:GntR family transcriptional regulator n=1 Tax=Sphingomonas flavalba TaxID=2559804 RepID=UPI00109DEACA|nr:GntR family transcriptional regulator [Sphingomonas flavalba]